MSSFLSYLPSESQKNQNHHDQHQHQLNSYQNLPIPSSSFNHSKQEPSDKLLHMLNPSLDNTATSQSFYSTNTLDASALPVLGSSLPQPNKLNDSTSDSSSGLLPSPSVPNEDLPQYNKRASFSQSLNSILSGTLNDINAKRDTFSVPIASVISPPSSTVTTPNDLSMDPSRISPSDSSPCSTSGMSAVSPASSASSDSTPSPKAMASNPSTSINSISISSISQQSILSPDASPSLNACLPSNETLNSTNINTNNNNNSSSSKRKQNAQSTQNPATTNDGSQNEATPAEPLACKWLNCSDMFDRAEDLYKHLCEVHVGRKSTNNLSLTCKWDNCRVITVKRDHITSHIRVHVPLKPYKCESCSKTFKRRQDLKKHIKTHAEDSSSSSSSSSNQQFQKNSAPNMPYLPHGMRPGLGSEYGLDNPYHIHNPHSFLMDYGYPQYPQQRNPPSSLYPQFPPDYSQNLLYSNGSYPLQKHTSQQPSNQSSHHRLSNGSFTAGTYGTLESGLLSHVFSTEPSASEPTSKKRAYEVTNDFLEDIKRTKVAPVYNGDMAARLSSIEQLMGLTSSSSGFPQSQQSSAPQSSPSTSNSSSSVTQKSPSKSSISSSSSTSASTPNSTSSSSFLQPDYRSLPPFRPQQDLLDADQFLSQLSSQISSQTSSHRQSLSGTSEQPYTLKSNYNVENPVSSLTLPSNGYPSTSQQGSTNVTTPPSTTSTTGPTSGVGYGSSLNLPTTPPQTTHSSINIYPSLSSTSNNNNCNKQDTLGAGSSVGSQYSSLYGTGSVLSNSSTNNYPQLASRYDYDNSHRFSLRVSQRSSKFTATDESSELDKTNLDSVDELSASLAGLDMSKEQKKEEELENIAETDAQRLRHLHVIDTLRKMISEMLEASNSSSSKEEEEEENKDQSNSQSLYPAIAAF